MLKISILRASRSLAHLTSTDKGNRVSGNSKVGAEKYLSEKNH